VDTAERKANMPDLTKQGIDDVVLAAWKQNCIPCHGVIGRGDGPQGRSLRPPDFTNPRWHRTAIDSEMAYAIQKGRGNMPAFAHLPEPTVQGLVKLVRMLNPDRVKDAAPAEGNEPAPSEEKAPATAPAPQPQAP
jgi:mono/diheme cytochrome c family protein